MKNEIIEKQKFIEKQNSMRKQINFHNYVSLPSIKYIAGVDLAYWKNENIEFAVCCIVVIDFKTHDVIEKVEYMDEIGFPYIPGCLAFREIPLFIEANKKLKNIPDIYFFDGNGYLHPRHMGIATHAGILLGKPTIGVAKSYYKIEKVNFDIPDNYDNSSTDIVINNEIYGRVLRTRKNVKPVFISIGNMIDLETATMIVKDLITKESHIPLPTRLADIETHKMRKVYT